MSHLDVFSLLADSQVIEAALDQQKSHLDDKSKRNLKRLYNHFVRAQPSSLATRFHNLNSLTISEAWGEYISCYGTDPTSFLNGKFDDSIREEERNPVAVLLSRIHTTARIESPLHPGCALKNFHYLFFYDLLRQIFPKTKHTQKGLGPNLIAELERIASSLKVRLGETPGLQWDAATLAKWYDLGLGANILAARFGAGYLFVLDQHISEDFLRKLPKVGVVYDDVVSDLDLRLRLPQLLEDSQLGELGTALRGAMMVPFEGCTGEDLVAAR